MIHVVDTHRLTYRNAILRARRLTDEDGTTPIKFYNITFTVDSQHPVKEEAIGELVYTDEAGYLFYGTNKEKVSCLAVKESAIIQVSLDDGQNFADIEWNVVDDGREYLTRDDLVDHSLTFYRNHGAVEDKYNPADGPNELPKYLERDEIDLDNRWEEDTIILEKDDTQAVITRWTKIITIPKGFSKNIVKIVGTGRPGQSFTIINLSSKTITVDLVTSSKQISSGHRATAYCCQDNPYLDNYWIWVDTEPYDYSKLKSIVIYDHDENDVRYEDEGHYVVDFTDRVLKTNENQLMFRYYISDLINNNPYSGVIDIDIKLAKSDVPLHQTIITLSCGEKIEYGGGSSRDTYLNLYIVDGEKEQRVVHFNFGKVQYIEQRTKITGMLWYDYTGNNAYWFDGTATI